MKFKKIQRAEIDDDKWNQCVRSSTCFRHYGLTYFLDATCSWIGLVKGDYDCVWPIPLKNAYPNQVIQPLLAQQLGPFGEHLPPAEVSQVLHQLSKKYWKLHIKFNESIQDIPGYPHSKGVNVELDLNHNYESLRSNYNRNAISNLKKADRAGVNIDTSKSFEPRLLDLFRLSKGSDIRVLDKKFYADARKIYEAFESMGEAETRLASINGELLGGIMVLNVNQRLLLFFTANSPNARQFGVSHSLIDSLIKDYAGNEMTLDFEGSNNENLAFFYQSFGGEQRIYLQAQIGWHLPFL